MTTDPMIRGNTFNHDTAAGRSETTSAITRSAPALCWRRADSQGLWSTASHACAYLIQLPVAKPVHPGYACCRRSAKAGRAMDVHLQALCSSEHAPHVLMSA